jgi:type I restriction enzyme, S subunit
MKQTKYEKCELGDLIRIKHGYAFKSEYFKGIGKQIVLTPGNFFEAGGFKARPGKDRFYVGEYPASYLLNKDDLIIAMTEQGEGLLGSAALVPASNQYLHNQRIGLVSVRKSSQANKKFLYYLFNTNLVRQQIRNSSSGTKVRHTSPERMYRVQVKVPDVNRQKKIAAVLSAYDDLIENNNRRIALLEKMAEEIYREWFVQLRFPGHEGGKLAESESSKSLQDVCESIVDCEHKTAPTQDTGYPSVRTPNIGRGRLLLDNVNRVSESTYKLWTNRAIPSTGDLVLAREAPVGNVAVIPRGLRICLGQRTILIRPNKIQIEPHYLLFLLLSKEVRHNLLGLSTGATVSHLNMRDIRNLKLPNLPPIGIQQKFESIVSKKYDLISILDEQNRNLTRIRDRLLTRLISGKLSVEDLDIQFPPSMTTDT